MGRVGIGKMLTELLAELPLLADSQSEMDDCLQNQLLAAFPKCPNEMCCWKTLKEEKKKEEINKSTIAGSAPPLPYLALEDRLITTL